MTGPSRLGGVTCLLVGGTGGIGAAIGRRLIREGARCHASTRTDTSVGRVGTSGMSWSMADVGEPADIARMAAEAIAALGRVDALVYCPAVAAVGPFDELTVAQWDKVMNVNVRGFALATLALLPHWRSIGAGQAVAITTQAARRGQSLIAAYTASKAAVEGLIRALAVELAPTVRLNAVAPGIVLTEMIERDFRRQAALYAIEVDEIRRRTEARIPLGRTQSAETVAGSVSFLLSPDAADITGHVLAVDGGMSC